MKRKRVIALLTALTMLAGLITGCGASGETQETAEPAAAQEEAGEETLAEESSETASAEGAEAVTIWYYWETEGHQVALDQVIQEYNASQSNYQVTAKYVPFADFKKQLSIGASADELPDIAILDSPDHASYVDMGIFEDITGKFDVSSYYEGTVNSCTVDGKLYGVPFGVNCIAL